MLKAIGIFILAAVAGQSINAQPLHGPNVNPGNMPILMAWETWMEQEGGVTQGADIIGDNLSINTWEDFSDVVIEDSNGDPQLFLGSNGAGGPVAETLNRWLDAFDGDGFYDVDQNSSTPKEFIGNPKKNLADYVVEFAIPMFPSLPDVPGTGRPDISLSPWTVYDENHPLHDVARDAYKDLANALKLIGFQNVRIRLAWEMSGDWFPWGTPFGTQNLQTFDDPYEDEFKLCWEFIYNTMEAEFPELEWVWCTVIHLLRREFDD